MMKRFFVEFINSSVIATTLFLFPFFTNVYAQHYTEITTSNGEHIRLDNPIGTVYSVLSKDGKIQSVQMLNPEEVVRLIVTFRDPPLAVYQVDKSPLQRSLLSSVYETLQAGHESFRTSLNTIQLQLSVQLKSDYSFTIKRDYYRALNGVALECKRRMINKIRTLPMVKYVSLDREVKANLTQSVHQIRADIVQDSLGITGDGVLVGDVDTGIDYNNPALGGGFGPAFRVIGGYDFANNDNDPLDDHGHGTHVAGIIGANGDTLRGVAPDVNFLAVKVLNAYGSGYESNVIAGVDYCLDPDGNPATDDAVDIINMSLGGAPSTEDPLEKTVDNATTAGVLCVVAAGNSGYGRYGTIISPGTSESALTVGACDSIDQIVYFSSMGPDPIHSSIKPEVVAPGFHILSTILNNQTASWSGTSMATPHVTGTAALLKQEHPLWMPEEIKAAIINTVHSVGDNVSIFAQGKGRIDALDAVQTQMVVEPGVMSFGYVDLEQDVWKDTLIMTVRNFGSVIQNTQISIVDGPPSGATLTFDKTAFSLAPGEETSIQAILSVPSSVPVLNEEPFAYLGKIKVTSDSDNVIVPFSFIKSTTLVITFDLPPVIFYLVDRAEGKIELKNFSLEGNSKFIIPISEGNSLDLLAIMEKDTLNFINSYLINHKVDNPTGLTYVLVSHEEASINMLGDTLYDIHNNKVTFDSTTFADIVSQLVVYNESFTYQSRLETGWFLAPNLDDSTRIRLFFTPLDSAFFIKKAFSVSRGLDNFVLKRSIFGLQNQQDIKISTGSDNLFGYEVTTSYDDPHLPLPSHWRKSIPVDLNTMKVYQGKYGYELQSVRLDFPSFYLNQDPPSGRCNFYFNKPGINDAENNKYLHSSISIGASYVHLHGISDSYIFSDPSTLRTPDFTINEQGEAIFEQMRVTPLPAGSPMAAELSSAYFYGTVKSGDTIRIEQNARVNFPDYMTYLSNGSIFMKCNNNWLNWEQADSYIDDYGGIKQTNGVNECRDNFNSHWRIPLFTTQVFAHNRAQINLRPFEPLNNPVLTNELSPYYEFGNMSNDRSTLQVLSDAYPYTILNQAGQCTADFEYQLPSEPSGTTYFPSFNLLQVSVDGRAVDIIQPDQNGKIRLILFDPDSSVTSTEISLMLASGDEINLPISFIGGNEYDAIIPTYIPSGFIDVVARIQDTNGNKCELTASPGFYFGNTIDNIKLNAYLRMTSYALDNVEDINMEAGDTLNYKLLYANYGSDIARNVVVTFPTTPYFTPIGSPSWTIDSLNVNDTVQVPINLLFLGKQQSTDEYTHYSPSITWTSGGTTYLRKHNVLIDFQNTITGIIQTAKTIPNRFELYQNYPNPFNPSTTVKYDLPKPSIARIEVYDILGRKIATLVDETKKAGSYQIIWNASRFASGVYFYRLEAGDYSATKKLLLLK